MEQQTSAALAAAQNLREVIIEHRDDTEQRRQVAQPIIDRLVESRLGRMALPKEYGGLEVPPAEALAVFEALAEAEASVAWIVWNSSLPCWFSRFLAQDVRNEIFSDPNALFASSTRPTGRATHTGDTYVVNGRWSLVSGCMHAAWIPVMCMVEEGDEIQMLAPDVPHMRMFFVPREKHQILDTWHVGGLRGTGSHDTILSEEVVPAGRSFAMGDPSLVHTPLGRVPIFSIMSAGCASICLGIVNAALQALFELATGKVPVDGGPGLRDRALVQALVARSEAQLAALRERLRSTCDKLWREAVSGNPADNADIAAVLGTAITTAQECREAATQIYAAAGTSSLYTDSPIERAHRDIHAVMQHIAIQPFWLEQAGKVSLGLEPTHPLFTL